MIGDSNHGSDLASLEDGATVQSDAMAEVLEVEELPPFVDSVPEIQTLPDGREALIYGDPEKLKEFNHPQGDNPFGFRGTCGLVSCEDVLRQMGVDVDEGTVVAFAILTGLCNTDGPPESCGGTTELGQAMILSELGVPSHTEGLRNLDALADHIEDGRGVIVEVNAGVLWNEPSAFGIGQANHAVVCTGLARDPDTGAILGFFLNDSGRGIPEDSGRFVAADLMQSAWADTGGLCVVTDVTRHAPLPKPNG